MINGVVREVIRRPWGSKTFYSLALVNEEELFGFGPKEPKVESGDKVAFEATKNAKGYWQADFNSLKVTKAEPEVRTNGASAVTFTRKSPDEKGYWERREGREVENDRLRSLGAARNTAIEWVKFLIEKEVLPMPKKASEREDALNAILDDYTLKFMSGIAPEEKSDKSTDQVVAASSTAEVDSEVWG